MRRVLFLISLATLMGVFYLMFQKANGAQPTDTLQASTQVSPADIAIRDAGRDKEALEKEMLESTVRIEIEAWLAVADSADENGLQNYVQATGNGHGTIKDGRYLVTHNHYGIPLSSLKSGLAYAYGAVFFYGATGEKLEIDFSKNSFTVQEHGPETLIFDFGLIEGQGVFAAAGLPSASFKNWEDLGLQPGMEVAQTDWDGAESRVDWVKIEEIIIDDGLPRLVLSGGLTPGSSGGGVYWNGYHVGNNWKYIETLNGNEETVSLVSVAILDPTDQEFD